MNKFSPRFLRPSDKCIGKTVAVPNQLAMKKYGGGEVQFHAFLILVLDGGENSSSGSGCFKIPPYAKGPSESLKRYGILDNREIF